MKPTDDQIEKAVLALINLERSGKQITNVFSLLDPNEIGHRILQVRAVMNALDIEWAS